MSTTTGPERAKAQCAKRTRRLVVTIAVEIESEPCGAGDSSHERQYFADAVQAVKEATGCFYQCDTGTAQLVATILESEVAR